MKKLKFRVKKWFFRTFVVRYLATVDSTLLRLFTKEEKESNKFSYGGNKANAKGKRIITMLSSKKYKDFFYKAIKHERNKPEVVVIQPYSNKIWDRIKHGIATAYLYLFDRNMYGSIQLFKKWHGKISTVESQINDYMANTTLDERVDRAIALGVIGKERGIAQKRMRKIQLSKVDKILAQNQA